MNRYSLDLKGIAKKNCRRPDTRSLTYQRGDPLLHEGSAVQELSRVNEDLA